MDWLHSGAVMHYSRYMEPQDGAMCVLLLSQRMCSVFRKKVTVLKDSCLRAVEIENVAV
jgi:hypothetical protein